jgi:hypothetical protein
VALLFDISGLRRGEGRTITEALLDWRLNGVPSDRHSEYYAYGLAESWTSTSVSVASHSEPEVKWNIEPLDYQRNGGGVVRLNVTDLVNAWVIGTLPNHGLMVTTGDVSRTNIAGQLAEAKLTVRYGFIK